MRSLRVKTVVITKMVQLSWIHRLRISTKIPGIPHASMLSGAVESAPHYYLWLLACAFCANGCSFCHMIKTYNLPTAAVNQALRKRSPKLLPLRRNLMSSKWQWGRSRLQLQQGRTCLMAGISWRRSSSFSVVTKTLKLWMNSGYVPLSSLHSTCIWPYYMYVLTFAPRQRSKG